MSDRSYPHQIDYVWLACDKDHHVAAFVTGGVGPIPTAVLQSQLPMVADPEPRICSLPKTSAARLLVSMPRPDFFIDLAQRGLFVYDWYDVHRPARQSTHVYECVAIPTVPVSADRLPDDVAQLLTAVTFKSVSFADAMAVDVRTQAECSEAK